MSGELSPIAILGMACRFPKGLDSIESLWIALKSRFSAIDTVPPSRWTIDRYFSSNPIAKGKSYMRRGGFLSHDISKFDAAFFGISPRDAENMDPQQRLLLEVVWEAFENSGMLLPDYSGHGVGVYVGGFMLDHMITQMSASNRSAINQNTAAGMMMTMLSNRISHTFDFRGPSLSIDTACSSSLVAFHYACQDLWQGNCELAVVGGSNVMLRPEYPMGMCKGHFLSRDGECKSFDARGDGYGRGEGAGIVLLKPLANALRDGDQILASVIGTGCNQDGRTPGISMPSGAAQQALIETVCSRYQIDPASICYVECHGTGTAIGDPTESSAIGAVYGSARRQKALPPVIVGSIKSNIGHLEAAAGVAGVIKATLTLLHRHSTPLANLQEPNAAIDLDDLHIRLSTDLTTLGDHHDELRVAVNSFGYGGTNAHAILQAGPQPVFTARADHRMEPVSIPSSSELAWGAEWPYMLPISGRSHEAVAGIAGNYLDLLNTDVVLHDVIYSAAYHRAHLSHRAMVKGNNREELMAALEQLRAQVEHANVVRDSETFGGLPEPVFVFTGMGPQWWGMGQELYQANSVYRNVVDEADEIFREISGFSVLKEMLKDEADSTISRTEHAQPANLLIQLGLLAVLNEAGVYPGAVVGHSVGELASAFAAGALSLHDTLTVCYHRSRLQASCRGTGSMLAVGLSKERILERIQPYAHYVSIAAVNGPANATIAGDSHVIERLASELTAENVFNKRLDVEVPYHSPMMEPILDDLKVALRDIKALAPTIALYSTVFGNRVSALLTAGNDTTQPIVDEQPYGAAYWPKNVRQPVEFAAAIQSLISDGYHMFLEVGPHPVLATSIRDCIKFAGKDCRTLYTLRRNQPEVSNLPRAVMSVYAAGGKVDWRRLCPRGQFTSLPNYAWQREHYWVENERAVQDRIAPIDYPILGIQEAPGAPVYRNDFDHETVSYLRDHVVTGLPILPAAAYVEALFELAEVQLTDRAAVVIRDFRIHSPMIINAERGLDCVTAYDPSSHSATIRSLENGQLGAGQVHVTAKLVGLKHFQSIREDLTAILGRLESEQDVDAFYKGLDQIGLSYGPAFRSVTQLKTNPERTEVLARIELRPELAHNLNHYQLHPTLLDACFQSLMVLLGNTETTFLPTGFHELCNYAQEIPQKIWCLAERVYQDERTIECTLSLLDDDGNVLAQLRSMRLTAASKRERMDRFGDKVKRQILAYDWSYGETLTEPKRLGHWLVIGDCNSIAQTLIDQFEQFGATIAGTATFGDQYQQLDNHFVLRSGEVEDATNMLQALGELDGILMLQGLAATIDSNDPTGEAALRATIAIVQAIAATSAERRPRVYLTTQCAFAIENYPDVIQPAQTAINGFVRVAFNELDGLPCSTIDLPSRISREQVDNLVLELLCDAEQDEVALRGSFRLCSQLLDSDVLDKDRIVSRPLSDDAPILVRPLRSDSESVGTARIVSAKLRPLQPDEIHLRVETTKVPHALLDRSNSDQLPTKMIEFVARVLGVGREVSDLAVGERVCGFGPADIASHFIGPRSQFYLVVVDEECESVDLVATLSIATRADFAAEACHLKAGQTALVEASPLGLALAEALERRGVQVARLSRNSTALPAKNEDAGCYSSCPEGIARSVSRVTNSKGFDAIAVHASSWQTSMDFSMLRNGGQIVDLDDMAGPIVLPSSAGGVGRTDFDSLQANPVEFAATVQRVVRDINKGTTSIETALKVTVVDLAWQKLPLATTNANLVLTYETRGGDLPVVQLNDLSFIPDATYLVTGGFGGFGQKTAEWLVDHGARHLVLTGRTGADTDARRAFVEYLEKRGVAVCAVGCDTSDFERLGLLLTDIAERLPPLKGVFHSGAEIIDQPIHDIDFDTFVRVMRSKALGAWNLHLLTKNRNLEHFVLYSSVANLVGNSRQAAYSAANGFLNGLAHLRHSQGLPATSVNWGAIADVGVVAQDEKLEQFLRYTGLRGIDSSEGLELLKIGLAQQTPQFGVTMITSWSDWARFETRGATSPRFAQLIAADSSDLDHSTRDALRAELSTLDHDEQVELLATLMSEIIASVLKADPTSVPFDKSINQLGVDSLMATEIQMLLDTQLGLNISILELIGDTTVRALAMQSLKGLDVLS